MTMFRRAMLAAGMLAWLGGCATPSEPQRMTLTQDAVSTAYPSQLHNAMCVRQVEGGESTNPLWVSKLGNEEFRAALAGSLQSAGLASPNGGCRYSVDVMLLGLSQPTLGFAMEVTLHANYKVHDAAGRPVLQETISAPYTAAFGESPIGFVRLKRANEGAVRESIAQFLAKLRAATLAA